MMSSSTSLTRSPKRREETIARLLGCVRDTTHYDLFIGKSLPPIHLRFVDTFVKSAATGESYKVSDFGTIDFAKLMEEVRKKTDLLSSTDTVSGYEVPSVSNYVLFKTREINDIVVKTFNDLVNDDELRGRVIEQFTADDKSRVISYKDVIRKIQVMSSSQ